MHENLDEHTVANRANEREKKIRASAHSLFRRCTESRNPVLAFSRACSKVGYLARDGVRDNLFHLVSALNEHKLALLMRRNGSVTDGRQHAAARDEALRAFGRAVRRELLQPRAPVSTRDLLARINRNLEAGQWRRSQLDLDELARRPDVREQLRPLAEYSRTSSLRDEQFVALEQRIERCNAHVREQREAPGPRGLVNPRDRNDARSLAPSDRSATAPAAEPHSRRGVPHGTEHLPSPQRQQHRERGLDR
jgi:hypothetical protein